MTRSTPAVPAEDIVLAQDGVQLAARFYPPSDASSGRRGAVLIAPAMGVAQDYYAPSRAGSPPRGSSVATFDYRGIGRSRQRRAARFRGRRRSTGRGSTARRCSTRRRRAAAGRAAVLDRPQPGRPDPAVRAGHERLAQDGHRRHRQRLLARERAAAATLRPGGCGSSPCRCRWRSAATSRASACARWATCRKGVMEQWRRWCLQPDYAFGAEGESVRAQYDAVRLPIVALSFTDDEYMSRAQHRVDPRLLPQRAADHEAHRPARRRRAPHRSLRLLPAALREFPVARRAAAGVGGRLELSLSSAGELDFGSSIDGNQEESGECGAPKSTRGRSCRLPFRARRCCSPPAFRWSLWRRRWAMRCVSPTSS